ncbi:MAG: hypothetical protein KGQ79_10875 [Proteobacteria bacterium]|nr:hypothetical protein [Pseudomonadota bacterium]MBU6426211.1 hypothetical protein [Rhodospirillales bacterium]
MSTPGISMASPAALAHGASGNTTSKTAMADGATVTTVRDQKSEIVSITTTPPTRPPEPGSAVGAGINLTA